MAPSPQHWDDVVVGAGSAGAVLGARLSEDGARRVLVLEAGPASVRPDELPSDIADVFTPSRVEHDWGLRATARTGRSIPFPRGRIAGGCSAVNAAVALRGVPADYDRWEGAGNAGWGWSDLAPEFRRIEADELGDGGPSDVHGHDGPLPIVRWRPDELAPLQQVFTAAAVATGHPEVVDHNDGRSWGIGPIPMNRRGRLRVSTAVAYLAPALPRPNLTVQGGTTVDRVRFRSGRVVGVDALVDGRPVHLAADRVHVCAGAVLTPGVLVRSGIGPAATLAGLDITVESDRPGVGLGLEDHVGVPLFLPQHVVPAPEGGAPIFQTILRRPVVDGGPSPDLQIYAFAGYDPAGHPLLGATGADRVAVLFSSLQRPHGTGAVVVRSADPAAPPDIELRYLDDPADLAQAVAALRLAGRLAATTPLRALTGGPLFVDPAVADDAELGAYARLVATTTYHPAGTARMGPDTDPRSVVDADAQVIGVQGLSVVDASILPSIPSVNINLPVIAVAEHVVHRWAGAPRPEPATGARA